MADEALRYWKIINLLLIKWKNYAIMKEEKEAKTKGRNESIETVEVNDEVRI